MSDIKWIKVAIGMFEDNKIDFIRSLPEGDAIIVTWVQMLTIAGQSNIGGYLMVAEGIPYTEQLLCTKLRRQPVFMQFALETLMKLKMIDVEDGPYHITKWEKHQNVEGMEKVRLQTNERVKRHRSKEKNKLVTLQCNADVTLQVTQCNATELELEKELNIYTRDDVKDVFDHWNSKGIKKHRELTQKMKSAINARLQSYTVDELAEAIDNYHTVVTSDLYFFSYKWTLEDFMKADNVVNFITENDPFTNYRRTPKERQTSRTPVQMETVEVSKEAGDYLAKAREQQRQLNAKRTGTP